MTEQTPVRRRARRTPAPGADNRDPLSVKLERLHALKVAQDEAEAEYKAAAREFEQDMKQAKRTEHTIEARGNRPAVKAALTTRDTVTIDPRKFRKEVSEKEFMDSVSVTLKSAKELMGETTIDKVSTKKTSAPFLSVRVLGKSRKG